ncbi:uncharacterized protein BT62DRAFT_189639 [Guyanagaster necrorhizus]|uniref:Uncharacterized protein n=1 Tax=Guyanagaster necrorhizus TaxID=856835 RepID=A0A9P7VR08_9AGAR|nr:uncharacterized protein BT62DRAFT_189639 [Guyanagaster necrorhizus MCA 3950]KAG7445314.1 hypothetical protein BT62DRAFT_189639 [Guyanagaster necrorhizus MCA 3950]
MFSRIDSTETTIPELTNSEVKDIRQFLDRSLNETVMCALLHGFYTGVVAVTMWTLVSRKNCGNSRRPRFFIVIILLLYAMATFILFFNWMRCSQYFIAHGQNFWTTYDAYTHESMPMNLIENINAALSTLLADTTLIWRC